MKFYQRKNSRKFFYPLIFMNTFVMGFATLIMIGDFSFVEEGSIFVKVFGGLLCGSFTLAGVVVYIYLQVNQVFKSTVEISDKGIIYHSKSKEITMKWDDIDVVTLYPRYAFAHHRLIFFIIREYSQQRTVNMKISKSMIYSEYNDLMLEEVKKFWKEDIKGEDKYIAYKKRKRK